MTEKKQRYSIANTFCKKDFAFVFDIQFSGLRTSIDRPSHKLGQNRFCLTFSEKVCCV